MNPSKEPAAMICIDFGNSYTKVAIRRDPNQPANLMSDAGLILDEDNICVPTLAAFDPDGAGRWYYGLQVLTQREESGIQVHRNWKPKFFEGCPIAAGVTKKRSANSTAVLTAAPPPWKLAETDWLDVREMLQLGEANREQFETFVYGLRGVTVAPSISTGFYESVDPEPDLDIKVLAMGYFQWLREELVTPACRRMGLPDAEQIPARITLPSFGGMTKATELLSTVLAEAGWNLDPKTPTLAEPLANAIGIFTEGNNCLHTLDRRGTYPHYPEMFSRTGLVRAMRKAGLANGPKTSWTLIIDVGSYTTDCAVIGFDLKDIDRQLDGEVEGLKRRDHVSSPLGIIALDHRIRQIVPDAQSQAIHEMLSDSRPDRIERFHRTLYGESKPYNAGRAGRIGSGTHMEPARECVRTFAEDISRFAEKFIEAGQYPEIDDLILTGGGMMIAAIRDEVTAQLKAMNRLSKLVQIHAHCPERELRRDYHRLTRSLMRGATALGGASVFFDYLGT